MTKVKSDQFANSLARAGPETRLFLFYGADEANSAALAEKTRLHLGGDAEKVELSGSQIKEDPALLLQEAASLSLFGDRRTILVQARGEECRAAITMLLEAETIANPAIVQISGITDRSATAKLVAKDPNALGCISYQPDLGQVAQSVRAEAEQQGLAMPREIAENIARYTRLDRRLAAMEVEKIALYLDAQPGTRKSVDHVVMSQLAAETDEDALAPALNAIMSGQMAQLPGQLTRLSDGTLQPVLLLRALEARAIQLAHIHSAMRRGLDSDKAIKAAGIFWKESGIVRLQSQKWPPAALERLTERLIKLHADMMQNSQDAIRLLAQESMVIAMNAARSRRH